MTTYNKGFSLIELLIVVVIITFLVTLVSPASMRLFDNINSKMDSLRFNQLVKKASFEAFVRQQNCKIIHTKIEKDDTNLLQIFCDKQKIADAALVMVENDSYKKIVSQSPLLFNNQGMLVSSGRDK